MEIPTEAGALVRNDNVVRGALPSANSNLSVCLQADNLMDN